MELSSVANLFLALAALPVAAGSAYLLLLTALSGRMRRRDSAHSALKFEVVVPAHDEEAGIAATVASLLSSDYPAAQRRVVVVADNCSDDTARVAAAAGASVIVRVDPARRGKGYALALAFERATSGGFADAVAVVDADTVVSRDFLRVCAARIEGGAEAVQVSYGVRNPGASWRTRLLAIAFALVHDVRSRGRERLRCSAGLRGNGMCFTARVLREAPYQAFSIVEDVEYGIRLGLAGHRVHFASEASVLGDMPAGADAARSQRRRWEGGRLQMARTYALPLLRSGVSRPDRVLLDLGLDLVVPPLGYLGAAAAAGLAATLATSALLGRAMLPAGWLWAGSLFALAIHVLRGWALSRTGLAGLAALALSPFYVAWKVGVALTGSRRPPDEWVRTAREGPELPSPGKGPGTA